MSVSVYCYPLFFYRSGHLRDLHSFPTRRSSDLIASGITDKYRVFIVVETINDAYRLAKLVPEIKLIDLGLSSEKEGSTNIAKSVYVTKKDIEQLTELENDGVKVLVKQAPGDPDTEFSSLIN